MGTLRLLSAMAVTAVLGGAAAGQTARPAAGAPAAPHKLTAAAYVTVPPSGGAGEGTLEYVAKAVAKGLPEAPFEKLIVIADGTFEEARKKAMTDGAEVFLRVVVGQPKRLPAPRVTINVGRRPRTITPPRQLDRIRSTVTVDLSLSVGKSWQQAKSVTVTSGEAPGAESEFADADGDFSQAWGRGAAITAKVAVQRVLNEYFLNGVTLRAVEVEPPKDAKDPNTGKPGDQTGVKIELTNRSHCRVMDATVTAQRYDSALDQWIPIDQAGGIRGLIGRPGRPGQPPQPPPDSTIGTWTIRAYVDSGQKAFSDQLEVSDAILLAMKNKTCRLVLQATPAVTALLQPSGLATLKPDDQPKP